VELGHNLQEWRNFDAAAGTFTQQLSNNKYFTYLVNGLPPCGIGF
jgi:hypothetical protein